MKKDKAFKRNLLLGVFAALIVAVGCVPTETFTDLIWDESNWDDADWGMYLESSNQDFV